MKILYLLSGTSLGGATLSFLTLLDGVTKMGNTAAVIVPNENLVLSEKFDSLGVKQYVIPVEFRKWPKLYGLKRFLGYPVVLVRMLSAQTGMRKYVCEIVEKEKPDLVHSNVSPLDLGHFAAAKYSVPHVWHIREYCDRDFSIHLFPSKKIYRRKFRNDYTVCITKDLQRYNGLEDNPRSFVIYNGVRSAEKHGYFPQKQKFFLSASRISEEKGHETTIRVFSKFCKSHPDFNLILLGYGYDYYVKKCKDLAIQLGIGDKVLFPGFSNDVDSYMSKAVALLVASPSEGFGRMTAEASFAGCMVLGYNAAGTKEILDATNGGILWNDEDEYLNAMERVAAMSETEYSKTVLAAQNIACRIYSHENYVDSILRLYNSILKNVK